MSQDNSQSSFDPDWGFGTPEDIFVLPKELPQKLPIDAINCALSRANAILMLLVGSGANLEDGFDLRHDYIMDAICCLQGQIAQARTILNCAQEAKQ